MYKCYHISNFIQKIRGYWLTQFSLIYELLNFTDCSVIFAFVFTTDIIFVIHCVQVFFIAYVGNIFRICFTSEQVCYVDYFWFIYTRKMFQKKLWNKMIFDIFFSIVQSFRKRLFLGLKLKCIRLFRPQFRKVKIRFVVEIP